MLNKEQIEQNKKEFIDLINSIERDFDKEKFINWLNKSNFFESPATTKYHCSFEGGLCEHSLNVYYVLKSLNHHYMKDKYSDDSIKIVGLLHDIYKANLYEKYAKNVKDEQTGEWKKVEDYRVIKAEDRFLYGSNEQTTLFMVQTFIPLELEEQVALLHSQGGMGYDSTQVEIGAIFNRYNLACLLHTADMLSSYCVENE